MPAQKKWKDEMLIDIYELARSGMTDQSIAPAIGVSTSIFNRWKKNKPALQHALSRARKGDQEDVESFRDYVYDRLTPELQALWDEIHESEDEENGVLRIEALLQNHGKQTRQQLFLYALVHHNFNPSQACRSVMIARQTYEDWIKRDLHFKTLIDDIQWHKKNFYEGALVGLVKKKNENAIMFANRTINRDRGYDDRQQIQIGDTIVNNTNVVKVSTLNLSLEARKEMYQAIQANKVLEAQTQAKLEVVK